MTRSEVRKSQSSFAPVYPLIHNIYVPFLCANSKNEQSSHRHTAELILQAFSHLTYVTAHSDSPSFPSLHLRHSSFSNPSLALPTSQVILQPFRCFTYITAHSPTLFSLLLRNRIFTYVTWRAAHGVWRRSGERHISSMTVERHQQFGGSILFWAGIMFGRRTPLVKIQ